MAQLHSSAKVMALPTRRRFKVLDIIIFILLLVFTFTSLAPFIFSFLSSFKTFEHILDYPPSLLPNPWTMDNYTAILNNTNFLRWLLNSFIFAGGIMLLNVLFSAMAGY